MKIEQTLGNTEASNLFLVVAQKNGKQVFVHVYANTRNNAGMLATQGGYEVRSTNMIDKPVMKTNRVRVA
ncbi:hypothetical protein [Synechococcus phage BUCT-ZZ01]|nr:hypothetical protein [Synechococcus phage BUCT-ZZ01]